MNDVTLEVLFLFILQQRHSVNLFGIMQVITSQDLCTVIDVSKETETSENFLKLFFSYYIIS